MNIIVTFHCKAAGIDLSIQRDMAQAWDVRPEDVEIGALSVEDGKSLFGDRQVTMQDVLNMVQSIGEGIGKYDDEVAKLRNERDDWAAKANASRMEVDRLSARVEALEDTREKMRKRLR